MLETQITPFPLLYSSNYSIHYILTHPHVTCVDLSLPEIDDAKKKLFDRINLQEFDRKQSYLFKIFANAFSQNHRSVSNELKLELNEYNKFKQLHIKINKCSTVINLVI